MVRRARGMRFNRRPQVGKGGCEDNISVFSQADVDGNLFYGVGLEYAFNQHWNICGEYELYEVDDFDIDVVSVGVSYHF